MRPGEGPPLTSVEFFWCAWAINAHMIPFHLVSAASQACESKHMLHLFRSAWKQKHHLAFPSLFPFMSSFIPSIFPNIESWLGWAGTHQACFPTGGSFWPSFPLLVWQIVGADPYLGGCGDNSVQPHPGRQLSLPVENKCLGHLRPAVGRVGCRRWG